MTTLTANPLAIALKEAIEIDPFTVPWSDKAEYLVDDCDPQFEGRTFIVKLADSGKLNEAVCECGEPHCLHTAAAFLYQLRVRCPTESLEETLGRIEAEVRFCIECNQLPAVDPESDLCHLCLDTFDEYREAMVFEKLGVEVAA